MNLNAAQLRVQIEISKFEFEYLYTPSCINCKCLYLNKIKTKEIYFSLTIKKIEKLNYVCIK